MGIGPCVLNVVNDKGDVWRDKVGLDGAEVDSGDVGFRVVVSKVDGPGAGSTPDVEDMVELLGKGRELRFPVKGQGEEVVLEVETILFALVIGEKIGAILVGVVCPAVFRAVAQDTGLEGGSVALTTLNIPSVAHLNPMPSTVEPRDSHHHRLTRRRRCQTGRLHPGYRSRRDASRLGLQTGTLAEILSFLD